MSTEDLKSTAEEIKRVIDGKTETFIGEMCGIVSAGGRGVRLRPHTLQKPKPLIEIGLRKQPLLYWSMLPMILGGISTFTIGVRYGANKIKRRFGKGRDLSRQFGRRISIDYVEEPEPLGRAGFIKYGLEKGVIDPDRPAIIFNASDILRLNLRDLVRHHLWLKACHKCDVVQVFTSGFRVRYGIGKVDLATSTVTDFIEKPLQRELTNTACYIIHGKLDDFKNINKIPSNPEDELVPKWIADKAIGAYIIPHESLISIKFEKDLENFVEMDLDHYIKSVYE